MTIDTLSFPFPLKSTFTMILEEQINRVQLTAKTAVTINFRDPDYSSDQGGYHPVEIRIDSNGHIQYITDFSFVGVLPFAELAKEIDFDISLSLFQHFGREFPIKAGQELFKIWQENFCSYYQMGVYEVSIQAD